MSTTADHRATYGVSAGHSVIAECLPQARLQDYLEGSLDDQQSDGIERHLFDCEQCRQRLSEILPSLKQTHSAPASGRSIWSAGVIRETAAIVNSWPTSSAGVPPTLPARFVPVRRLGGGGMGEVWEVHDQLLNRPAALKFLRAAAPALHDLRRFRKEAEALARLSHPGIVRVHEVLMECQPPALLMELISGQSLSEVTAGRALPDTVAARLLAAVADAAAHAHAHGVVHRDLKPANILLSLPGGTGVATADSAVVIPAEAEPLISDFGVAHLAGDQTLTCVGQLLGTPAYMAPEQTSGDPAKITPAVDIYGLGAVLYELLTGRPPFVTDDAAATLVLVRSEEPLSPRLLQPRVAADLETICLKCLAKNPADRYATAGALRDDLRAFLNGAPVSARPISRLNRFGRWIRRNRLLSAIATVALISLLGTALQAFYFGLEQAALRRQADGARQTAREHAAEAEARAQLVNKHLTEATRVIDRLIIALGPPQSSRVPPEQRRQLFAEMLGPFEDYVAWYCPNGVVTPDHLHVAQRLVWLKQQVDPNLISLTELQRIEDCIVSFDSAQSRNYELQNIAAGYFELAAGFHTQRGQLKTAGDCLLKAAEILNQNLQTLPGNHTQRPTLLRYTAGLLMNAQQRYFGCNDNVSAAKAAGRSCEVIEQIMLHDGITAATTVNFLENSRALTGALWNMGEITAARDAASRAACVFAAAKDLPQGARDAAIDCLRRIDEIVNSQPQAAGQTTAANEK